MITEKELIDFFHKNGFGVKKKKVQRHKIKFTRYFLKQNGIIIICDSIGQLFNHYQNYNEIMSELFNNEN